MSAMKQAMQQAGVVAPLATPQIGSNLDPAHVPTAKPEPQPVVVNAMTEAAAACARAIINAAWARFTAWVQFCDSMTSPTQITDAAQALNTELLRMGYKRAKQEASEFRAFASVYHYGDKPKLIYIVDRERKVRDTDSKGIPLKDATGEYKMRRPTTNEVIADIRSERTMLAKAGKLPAELVPNEGGAKKSEESAKLNAAQLSATLANIAKANEDQTRSIIAALLATLGQREYGAKVISALRVEAHKLQVEKGWVKKAERKMQSPPTA